MSKRIFDGDILAKGLVQIDIQALDPSAISGVGIIYPKTDGMYFMPPSGTLQALASESYVDSQISGSALSGGTNITINGGDIDLDDSVVLAGQITVQGTGNNIFSGDVQIVGNLTVQGTTTTVDTEQLAVADNIIIVNNGETENGVSAGSAGLEVDRGTAANYQFVFVEASSTFRIGELSSLQAVATREDAPNAGAISFWNDTLKRFDTDADLTYNATSNTITLGGETITSTKISGWDTAANISAGAGLTDTSGVFAVGSGNGITVNADSIQVNYAQVAPALSAGDDSSINLTPANLYYTATNKLVVDPKEIGEQLAASGDASGASGGTMVNTWYGTDGVIQVNPYDIGVVLAKGGGSPSDPVDTYYGADGEIQVEIPDVSAKLAASGDSGGMSGTSINLYYNNSFLIVDSDDVGSALGETGESVNGTSIAVLYSAGGANKFVVDSETVATAITEAGTPTSPINTYGGSGKIVVDPEDIAPLMALGGDSPTGTPIDIYYSGQYFVLDPVAIAAEMAGGGDSPSGTPVNLIYDNSTGYLQVDPVPVAAQLAAGGNGSGITGPISLYYDTSTGALQIDPDDINGAVTGVTAGSGLTDNSNKFDLGGTLTSNVLINGDNGSYNVGFGSATAAQQINNFNVYTSGGNRISVIGSGGGIVAQTDISDTAGIDIHNQGTGDLDITSDGGGDVNIGSDYSDINLTNTGTISLNGNNSTISLSSSGIVMTPESGQKVTIAGDLDVTGTTTFIDSTTVQVEDKNIELGKVITPTDITADGGGITLLGTTNKTFAWSNANTAWMSSEVIRYDSTPTLSNDNELAHKGYVDSAVSSGAVTPGDGLVAGTGTDIDVNPGAGIALSGGAVVADYAAIAAQMAGNGLGTVGKAANSLEIKVGTHLQIVADTVGINTSTLASAFAGNGLVKTGKSGGVLNVGAGVGLTISADAVAVNYAAVASQMAGSGLITEGKSANSLRVNTGAGLTISGDAVAVNYPTVVSQLAGSGLTSQGKTGDSMGIGGSYDNAVQLYSANPSGNGYDFEIYSQYTGNQKGRFYLASTGVQMRYDNLASGTYNRMGTSSAGNLYLEANDGTDTAQVFLSSSNPEYGLTYGTVGAPTWVWQANSILPKSEIESLISAGSFTLTAGNGTTVGVDTTSVDLGGALTKTTTVNGASAAYSFYFGGAAAATKLDTFGVYANGGGIYLNEAGGGGIYIQDINGGGIYIEDDAGGGTYFNDTTGAGVYINTGSSAVEFSASQMLITDGDNSTGLVYAADYSSNYGARSIPDVEHVEGVASGKDVTNTHAALTTTPGSTITVEAVNTDFRSIVIDYHFTGSTEYQSGTVHVMNTTGTTCIFGHTFIGTKAADDLLVITASSVNGTSDKFQLTYTAAEAGTLKYTVRGVAV